MIPWNDVLFFNYQVQHPFIHYLPQALYVQMLWQRQELVLMNYVVPVFAFVFLDIPSHTQDMPTVSIIARFTIFR